MAEPTTEPTPTTICQQCAMMPGGTLCDDCLLTIWQHREQRQLDSSPGRRPPVYRVTTETRTALRRLFAGQMTVGDTEVTYTAFWE